MFDTITLAKEEIKDEKKIKIEETWWKKHRNGGDEEELELQMKNNKIGGSSCSSLSNLSSYNKNEVIMPFNILWQKH